MSRDYLELSRLRSTGWPLDNADNLIKIIADIGEILKKFKVYHSLDNSN